MKYISLIFFLGYLNNLSAQDFMTDTCHLKGAIKSIIYEEQTYFSPDEIETRETLHYVFNKQNRTVKIDRSLYLEFQGESFNSSIERKFDNSGVRYSSEIFRQDHKVFSITDFIYDANGQLIQSNYFHENHKMKVNTTSYKYNELNQLIELKSGIESGEVFTENFKYDELGNKIYHADLSSTSRKYKFWTFNTRNLLTEEKYLDSNWASRTTFYIDSDNKIDSRSVEDFSKNVYTEESYIYLYKYDDAGQLVEKIETTANGKIVLKRTYTNNSHGDPINEVVFFSESNKADTISYEYIYDDNMNWISKITKINGDLFKIESNKITYF
ncbi:hypothetical protein GCM10009118_28710 [Wandonia haliotis]|uniref:Sugar-binding protein n=1 Tax=Wandonia haliotis TaxID=574963 RepID=A0ABN1MT03_9FLAO